MAENKPGEGLWGWLGRQVGHVKGAVKTDVTKPAQAPAAPQQPPPAPAAQPQQPAPQPETDKQILYREEKAEEIKLPDRPGVILRRTTIDEVIVDPRAADQPPGDDPPAAE